MLVDRAFKSPLLVVCTAALVACAAPSPGPSVALPKSAAEPVSKPPRRGISAPAPDAPVARKDAAPPSSLASPPTDAAQPVHPLIQGAKEVRITPRVFGVSNCQLKVLAVYRDDRGLTVAFEPAPCRQFRLVPQISLMTPHGSLRMTEISLPVEKDRQWPYPEMVRPVAGVAFYMRFRTDVPHSEAEAAASGIVRDLCQVWDCLNDGEGQRRANAFAVSVAASQTARAAGATGGVQHRLLSLAPAAINAHHLDGGTLDPLHMYFFGLSALAKSQPNAKSRFLQYLSSTSDYEAVGVADNPFDKEDFAKSIPRERQAFVDRMFAQSGNPPPKSVVIFGYASLDRYDIDSETLTFRSCRDHGSFQHGMFCSYGGLLLGSLQPIGDRALQIAQEGSLVSRGRARPRQYSPYHQNGPSYSLHSFGFPQNYAVKVPRAVARGLFEMAKGSPVPRYVRDQGFANKLVGLKLLLEDFSPIGLNNLSVNYSSTPKAFCMFDYAGQQAVYCADFPRTAAASK